MKPIVGIDLGTTNSEVAILREGRSVVVPDTAENRILPSFVGSFSRWGDTRWRIGAKPICRRARAYD